MKEINIDSINLKKTIRACFLNVMLINLDEIDKYPK